MFTDNPVYGSLVLRALVRVRERALGCFSRSPKSPPARRYVVSPTCLIGFTCPPTLPSRSVLLLLCYRVSDARSSSKFSGLKVRFRSSLRLHLRCLAAHRAGRPRSSTVWMLGPQPAPRLRRAGGLRDVWAGEARMRSNLPYSARFPGRGGPGWGVWEVRPYIGGLWA